MKDDDEDFDDELKPGYYCFHPDQTEYPGFTAYLDTAGNYYIYGSPQRPVAAGSCELEQVNRLLPDEAPDEMSMIELGHTPVRCEDLIDSVEYEESAKQIISFCTYK